MREGIWKRDILVAGIEEWEHVDVSEIHARRLNAEALTPKMVNTSYSQAQVEQLKSGGDQVFPKIHLDTGSRKRRRAQR